jgi:hypothetical protein
MVPRDVMSEKQPGTWEVESQRRADIVKLRRSMAKVKRKSLTSEKLFPVGPQACVIEP